MPTFLKLILAVAALFSIVPLAVWASSGNWRHAVFSAKRFLLIVACIVVPGVLIGAVLSLTS